MLLSIVCQQSVVISLRCDVTPAQLDDDFLVKYQDGADVISIVTVDDFKECINETIESAATLYLVVQRNPKETKRTLSITSTQT